MDDLLSLQLQNNFTLSVLIYFCRTRANTLDIAKQTLVLLQPMERHLFSKMGYWR